MLLMEKLRFLKEEIVFFGHMSYKGRNLKMGDFTEKSGFLSKLE